MSTAAVWTPEHYTAVLFFCQQRCPLHFPSIFSSPPYHINVNQTLIQFWIIFEHRKKVSEEEVYSRTKEEEEVSLHHHYITLHRSAAFQNEEKKKKREKRTISLKKKRKKTVTQRNSVKKWHALEEEEEKEWKKQCIFIVLLLPPSCLSLSHFMLLYKPMQNSNSRQMKWQSYTTQHPAHSKRPQDWLRECTI